jgi:FkbM family methyltransferase
MKYKNNIFDVGAFNGLDGLILAIKNPESMVHAFEANPNLIKEIKRNKKKIELFKKIKIKNYKINNYAVSNKNSFLKFNIAKNPTVSSLNEFSNNIDITWPGYREVHCTVVKKIKVKSITLEKYCNDNKINIINYLHIDTQGSDLKVLKGLKKKIKIVQKGVLEAALNKKNSLYKKNHTIKEAKFFLTKNKFKISKIEDIDENIKNEKNIFFYKKNSSNFKKINIKYNLRYYNRIISDRTNLKDKFINFF